MKKYFLLLLVIMGCYLSAQNTPYGVNELFQLALNHSGERAVLMSRVEQARGEKESVIAGRLPLVSASASYSYLGLPPKGVTLEAGELGVIPPGIRLPSQDTVFLEDRGNHYFQMGLILDQPLYTWGKLEGAIEAARGSEELQRAALRGEERKIHTEIRTLVTTLSLLQAMDEDLSAQEEIVPRLIRIVDQSLAGGFLLKEDLLEVKILSQQVALSRQELNNRRNKLLNRLSRLTGEEKLSPSDLILRAPPNPAGTILSSEENLIQGLWQNNSDLSQLSKARDIREDLTRIAAKEKTPFPDLGFRLELGYAHDALPFTETELTTGLSATVSLFLKGTLFDGGRDKAAYDTALAREEEARLSYHETRLVLEDRIGEDLSELALIEARIIQEKLITEKIQEEIKVKKNLWQTGSAGEEELLKKELEALMSNLNVKGEMINFYTLLYSLDYLTGSDL